MKKILLLFVLLFSAVSAYAGDALTKEEWIKAISEDAKESSLEAKLGPPDFKRATGSSTRYYWHHKFNTGTTSPESLGVSVATYKGVLLIVAIYDPVTEECTFFPWYNKVMQVENDPPKQQPLSADAQVASQTDGWTEEQLQATLISGDIIHGDGVQSHGTQGGYGTSLVDARRNALQEVSYGRQGKKVVILSENSKIISTDKSGIRHYAYRIIFETGQ